MPNKVRLLASLVKIMKKTTIISIVIILVVVIAGGVIFYQQSQPKTSGKIMTVGKYYWPGMYWVEIAEAKGWFKEAGLNVRLVDTNKDYYGSQKDVVSGKLDTQNFWVFDLITHDDDVDPKGADLVIVVNTDTSLGSEAIVVSKEISSLVDLKGKKIGVEAGSAMEFILYEVLKSEGLTFNDIVRVSDTTEKLPAKFVAGELDAVAVWEPITAEALKKESSRKLWDSSQMPGVVSAGYVFRKDFIERRPEDIQAFVKVWHKTAEFIKNHPNEAFAVIAKNYSTSLAEVESFTKLNQILDLDDNLDSFVYGSSLKSLHGQIKEISKYLLDQKIIQKNIDSTEIINPQFIRALIN